MKGIIKRIDLNKGLVYVDTENGDNTIFEIISDDNFESGDRVFWKEHYPLGDCEIFNITKNEKSEVYFQDH